MRKTPQGRYARAPAWLGAEAHRSMPSSAPRARCSRRALRASISPVSPSASSVAARRAQRACARRRATGCSDPRSRRCRAPPGLRAAAPWACPAAAVRSSSRAHRRPRPGAMPARPSRPLPRASRISRVSAWSSRVCAVSSVAMPLALCVRRPSGDSGPRGRRPACRSCGLAPSHTRVACRKPSAPAIRGDGPRLGGRLRPQPVVDGEDDVGGGIAAPAAAASPQTAPSAPCCRCRPTPPARRQRRSAPSRGWRIAHRARPADRVVGGRRGHGAVAANSSRQP